MKIITYRLIILICLLISAVVPATAQAPQTSPSQWFMDQLHRSATRTMNFVLTDINQTLDPQHRMFLGEIDFSIDRYDMNVYGVFADRDPPRVVMSIGFTLAVLLVSEAFVISAQSDQVSGIDVFLYATALADILNQNSRRTRLGLSLLETPRFDVFLGWSAEEYYKIVNTQQFESERDLVMMHAFALILGHEIAHHFLGHLDHGTASSIDVEKEADELGIRLALNAGYNVLFGHVPFLFYMAIEGDSAGIYFDGRSHPPALCRLMDVMHAGIEAITQDPAFRGDPDFEDALAQLEADVWWFERLIETEDIECIWELSPDWR
jgi:hypothetical protein